MDKRFAVIFGVLVAGGLQLQAAVTTSVSAAAPSDNVVISQTEAGSSAPWRQPASADPRAAGQTFRVGSEGFTLDKITVEIDILASAGYDAASFNLFIYTYATENDVTPDSTISSQSGILPAGLKSSFDSGSTYLTFDIDDVVLSANQQYGFFLVHTGGARTSNMLLDAKIGSTYTGGIGVVHRSGAYQQMKLWNGSSPQPADLTFYLQKAAPAPVAPAE